MPPNDLSSSVATEVAALGVSGSKPPLSHTDLEEGQMLLSQDNLQTNILSLPVETPPSSSHVHHPTNLMRSAEDKVLMCVAV